MIAQTAAKTREHLQAFSGRLSAGLCKPARRFVGEALYGIAARGSVRLSEIGRALEEPIALIKTETRLSRNLARPELAGVGDGVLAEGAGRVGERTLIVLDLSDIAKPYAEKMEHLARVRDGSTGTIADGYWLAQVIGVENEDNAILPLYAALWSQKAPDFVSENEEILTAIRTVAAACHGRGVWVVDRGGDRGELYAPLIAEGHSFVIRNKGARKHSGTSWSATHERAWPRRPPRTSRGAARCTSPPTSCARSTARKSPAASTMATGGCGCAIIRTRHSGSSSCEGSAKHP